MGLVLLLIAVLVLILVHHYVTKWELYQLAWKLPGPFSVPILGSLGFMWKMREDPLKINTASHLKYGDRFRYWLGNELVVMTTNPKDIEIMLNNRNCLDKFDPYYGGLVPLVGRGLLVARKIQWLKNRKLLAPTYTKPVLDSFVGEMYLRSEAVAKSLKENFGEGFHDVYLPMYDYAMGVFCASFMGVEGEILNRRGAHWGELIAKAGDLLYERLTNIFYATDFVYHLTKDGKECRSVVATLHALRDDLIAAAKNNTDPNQNPGSPKHKFFINHLFQLQEEGKMTQKEVEDDVITALIGATDTSALGLSFICECLGIHPEIQQIAYQEIMDVVGPTGPITLNHLHELKYIERIVYEGLRMFSVVPHILRTLDGPIEFDGVTLPPKASIGVLLTHHYRKEGTWVEPLKFDPDRFIPEECAKRHPYDFVPFSVGPRNCIGGRYALTSVKMMLSTLIRRFTITSQIERIEDITFVANVFLTSKQGFWCTLTPRNP